MATLASVAIIGAGGNIGSHVVPLVARMAGVGRIILIDRGTYEESNWRGQAVGRHEVMDAKALVQARRARRINPDLDVTAVVDGIENVPLGLLRGSVLLGCLDSRAARLALNLAAWRVGSAWVDAGVHAGELLARINVYLPGPDQPCMECGMDDRDYALVEQAYPCAGEEITAPATNAPASLGALAASLQALECEKLLRGAREQLAVGCQVTISALAHRHLFTRFRRNAACRFDHGIWDVEPLAEGPAELTLARVLALGERVRVAQQTFARTLACLGCGQMRDVGLHLVGRLSAALRRCPGCGVRLRPSGMGLAEWLAPDDVPAAMRDASLASVGVRAGDVLSVAASSGVSHFQIGGSS